MQPSDHAHDVRLPNDPSSVDVLTPRECDVAALIAEGLSNKEIAQQLTLVEGTVGNHVANIMWKLGAKNRVQIAVWAVEQGL
jgi:DNA-binding NarL/FixJ family response regulator